MNAQNIVKEIMKIRDHNYRTLAKKLGYVSKNGDVLPTAICNRLSDKQDMRVDTLVKFLNALDCELIIRSGTSDHTEWIVGITEQEG